MKKLLITGTNSYIGTSVEKWLVNSDEKFEVKSISLRNEEWENFDFSKFDSVLHVAGIAHFSKDVSKKDQYYKINTSLTEKVAKKAKKSGIKQFIFMSSIIIYGDSSNKIRIITDETEPSPTDFYGDSKLQAEKKILSLESENFKIAIIRPPMIFGKGSKGNYVKLSKLSKITPVIPIFKNQRSMLHIDNLCEFIKQIILREKCGIFFPQNKEFVCTSEMMIEISKVNQKKKFKTKIFNPIINILFFSDIVKKMFGNLVYDQKISEYDFEYCINDFYQSIHLTEKN